MLANVLILHNVLLADKLTGESIFLHLDFIDNMLKFTRSLFPSAAYGIISVPTYPSGNIGFIMAAKNQVQLLKHVLINRYNALFSLTYLLYV